MKIYTREELQKKDMLTVQQAAIYAQRSVDTIRRWIREGYIKAHKHEVFNRNLVDRESIDNYLESLKKG